MDESINTGRIYASKKWTVHYDTNDQKQKQK